MVNLLKYTIARQGQDYNVHTIRPNLSKMTSITLKKQVKLYMYSKSLYVSITPSLPYTGNPHTTRQQQRMKQTYIVVLSTDRVGQLDVFGHYGYMHEACIVHKLGSSRKLVR